MTDQTPTPSTSTHRTMADYYASRPVPLDALAYQAGRDAKVTIYAAVIEWPSEDGEPPRLVLSRSKEGIKAEARDEIEHMLSLIVPERMVAFRKAFAADPDNYIEHIMDGDGDHPYVTFDEQEV